MTTLQYAITAVLAVAVVIVLFWRWRDALKAQREKGRKDAEQVCAQYGVKTAKEMAEKMEDSAYKEGFLYGIEAWGR